MGAETDWLRGNWRVRGQVVRENVACAGSRAEVNKDKRVSTESTTEAQVIEVRVYFCDGRSCRIEHTDLKRRGFLTAEANVVAVDVGKRVGTDRCPSRYDRVNAG